MFIQRKSSNDGKRIQTFDKISTYPYGTSVFKVCENEMKNVCNAKETLGKNDELYITCSIFLNYPKRKCAMEMKRHEKLPKKRYKINFDNYTNQNKIKQS